MSPLDDAGAALHHDRVNDDDESWLEHDHDAPARGDDGGPAEIEIPCIGVRPLPSARVQFASRR